VVDRNVFSGGLLKDLLRSKQAEVIALVAIADAEADGTTQRDYLAPNVVF
jgi:hypothetical protein